MIQKIYQPRDLFIAQRRNDAAFAVVGHERIITPGETVMLFAVRINNVQVWAITGEWVVRRCSYFLKVGGHNVVGLGPLTKGAREATVKECHVALGGPHPPELFPDFFPTEG